jgi:hypothetical protein
MTDGHLDEETWERLACGELGGARAGVMEHIVECPPCARTYRAILEMTAGARSFDPGAPGAARPRSWSWRPLVAAGGALALAAALVLFLRSRPQETDDERLRAPTRPEVTIVEGAPLRWKAMAGAETYRVRIYTAEGTPAWSSAPSAELEVAPPELPPGAYRWEVEALRGGDVVARSRLTQLRR